MNRTLREYLKHADDTYNLVDKHFINLTDAEIEDKILQLQSNIKTMQAVAFQIANVSNILVRSLKQRTKKTIKYINPYPTYTDIGLLKSLNPEESKEVVKNISIPVTIVDNITDIPCSTIYYINNLKQYAINIGGIVIKGNLGNIVDYQGENSVKCEFGSTCNSLLKKTKCTYYHEPEDYLAHGLEIPDYTKNFTTGSWIYSKDKTTKTYFTRHIGSKDRLIHDLTTMKKRQYLDEISNREGQLIHDLLIYMILNSNTMLNNYIPWEKMPRTI